MASAAGAAPAATTAATAGVAAPLPAFVAGARKLVEGGGAGSGAVTVVMGNQAADADSIISSITYAYYKSLTATAGEDVLALLSITQAELKLRRETCMLLEKAGIATSDLVFWGDIDLDAMHAAKQLRLVLVDHNALQPKLAHLGDAVTEIVDHHQDMKQHPAVTGDQRCISFDESLGRGVGSATTLVAERFKAHAADALPHVALPLLGVVLIDTANLHESKATPQDHAAAKFLAQAAGTSVDPTGLFKELNEAKFDPKAWAELTMAECLPYDYKQFDGKLSDGTSIAFGGSAILVPLQTLYKLHGDFFEAMDKFANDRKLAAFFVLTFVTKPKLARQVLLFAPSGASNSAEVFEHLMSHLSATTAGLELTATDLGPLPAGATYKVAAYEQANLGASRKKIVPLVFSALGKL